MLGGYYCTTYGISFSYKKYYQWVNFCRVVHNATNSKCDILTLIFTKILVIMLSFYRKLSFENIEMFLNQIIYDKMPFDIRTV